MADKEYVCGYSHCLHDGEKVKSSEAVVIGKKHFHWDCAELKQEITDCVNSYMDCIEDKTQYPTATRIINTLVFKNKVPIEYIAKNIKRSGLYYKNKPTYVLYGLRKLFWEQEFKEK
jgi:hypothetical protein